MRFLGIIAVHVVNCCRLRRRDRIGECSDLVAVRLGVIGCCVFFNECAETWVWLIARVCSFNVRERIEGVKRSLPPIKFFLRHDGAYLSSRIVDWFLPSPSTASSRNLRNSPTTVSMSPF